MRSILLSFVSVVLLAVGATAQADAQKQFLAEFQKGIELVDDKMIDKAVRKLPQQALYHYETAYHEKQAGKESGHAQVLALQNSWKRVFENGNTVDKLDRWLSGADDQAHQKLRSLRDSSWKLWSDYNDRVSKVTERQAYLHTIEQYEVLAQNASALGHYLQIADILQTAAVIAGRVPEKNLDDRRKVVDICERFLEARKSWEFVLDTQFLSTQEFVRAEKLAIEESAKKGEKRKAEGYDANAKGIDALVVPTVPEVKHAYKFEALATVDELDYAPRGGPVAPFWNLVSVGKVGEVKQLPLFKRRDLWVARTAPSKYGISLIANELKGVVDVEANNKFKVSTFWLDAEKKIPYAMSFWIGSDREMVNEAECNYEASAENANIYFRSAACWKGVLGTEPIVLYDDNCSGFPADGDPMAPEFKSMLLGDGDKGITVPVFDSMRLGKGPRVPFSEFVKLPTGWGYVKRVGNDELGVRVLNPEYVKSGKVKLVWNGPKPTVPVQLVVQGHGDYKTAVFDLAGGKEIEVPAAQYSVVYGRILIGKGPRAQSCAIYQGDSKPFTVEAGKVHELRMGAPFVLKFTRRGDETASIDATTIHAAETSGCLLAEFHGISLACEVLAAKEADGKGQKVVGKFLRFTDAELVNKAAAAHNKLGLLVACFPMPDGYREKEMVLQVKTGAPGMKLAIYIKKHPLFGPMQSPWQ